MFERLVFHVTDSEDYIGLTVLSVFFTLLSVFLVHRVVPFQVGGRNFAGVMAVLIVSLAMAYPFVRYLMKEERQEVQQNWPEARLLERHAEDLVVYTSYFLGTTVAFALSTFFVPESFYSVQLTVLDSLGAPTGNFFATTFFMEIVTNNLWVFFVTFILTFFVTSGVVFVLAWNASVLGVLVGTLSQSMVEVPVVVLPYLPHGILEIGGYVLAGIAGALFSYEVELLLFETEDDHPVNAVLTKDVATLLVLGVALIIVAGVIEAL